MYVVMCVFAIHGGQKSALDLLRLELQLVVNHQMGMEARSCARATAALNH